MIEADTKYLEWLAAVYLSKDKVGYLEISKDFDLHTDNQQRLKLPERLIAKRFLFRLVFGGSAYAYANDNEFNYISSSVSYWQKAIDTFYSKYSGLYEWHGSLMRQVIRNSGKLIMPTGRVYEYTKIKGEWPRTTILNYPVQGFGADLMSIARVSLFRRLGASFSSDVKLISTVHDSILIDCRDDLVQEVVDIIYKVWDDIPMNFERLFKSKFDLPLRCEVKVGRDWGNMKPLNQGDNV